MALRNSTNGEITRHYSIEELKDAADLMRGYDLVALNAAGSGHAGGTFSIMDITAALYLRVVIRPFWSKLSVLFIVCRGMRRPALANLKQHDQEISCFCHLRYWRVDRPATCTGLRGGGLRSARAPAEEPDHRETALGDRRSDYHAPRSGRCGVI